MWIFGREGRKARIFTVMFDETFVCYGHVLRGGGDDLIMDGGMGGWSVRGAGMKGVGGI